MFTICCVIITLARRSSVRETYVEARRLLLFTDGRSGGVSTGAETRLDAVWVGLGAASGPSVRLNRATAVASALSSWSRKEVAIWSGESSGKLMDRRSTWAEADLLEA